MVIRLRFLDCKMIMLMIMIMLTSLNYCKNLCRRHSSFFFHLASEIPFYILRTSLTLLAIEGGKEKPLSVRSWKTGICSPHLPYSSGAICHRPCDPGSSNQVLWSQTVLGAEVQRNQMEKKLFWASQQW